MAAQIFSVKNSKLRLSLACLAGFSLRIGSSILTSLFLEAEVDEPHGNELYHGSGQREENGVAQNHESAGEGHGSIFVAVVKPEDCRYSEACSAPELKASEPAHAGAVGRCVHGYAPSSPEE